MNFRMFFFLFLVAAGLLLSFFHLDIKLVESINSFFEKDLDPTFWSYGLQHLGIETALLGMVLFLSRYTGEKSPLLFLTAIVVSFFVFLFQYSANVPITDDYYGILAFANSFLGAGSVEEKVSFLFSFYHDSRIVVIRSFILGLYHSFGEINFKTALFISNLFLLFILYLFYLSLKTSAVRNEIMVIIALLLFQFGCYDAVVWLIPAFHYKLVIICLMLTLFFISKDGIAFQCFAFLSAAIGIFTVGNGWIIFPVVFALLLLEKKWKFLAGWAIGSAALATLYFWDYPMLMKDPSFPPVMDYFKFSFAFLGSAFNFLYKFQIAIVAGAVVWILFILLSIKAYHKKNPVMYGLIFFVLLSSLLAAHFRLSGGLSEAVSNRYGFYSIIAIAACISGFFEVFNFKYQKILLKSILVLSLAFHLLSGLFFFPEVPVRKQILERFAKEMRDQRPFQSSPPVIPGNADTIVKKAMENEIYFP